MKKIWVYLLGVLTGVAVAVIFAVLMYGIDTSAPEEDNGMTFFEAPSDIIETEGVKVFQALGGGYALANCKVENNGYWGTSVLLYNEERSPYYYDQVVNAPSGKCFKQVGIYHYPTKNGDYKTVPIVKLLDKK